jgi:hypothetical protein
MLNKLKQNFGAKEVATVVVALAAGLFVYSRDWTILFSGEKFYTPEYYQVYWTAFLFALALAVAITLISGTRSHYVVAAVMLPSLVLRHVLFLIEIGPTNTWPPAFAIDLVFVGATWLTCYGAEYARRVVAKKI